MGVNFQEFKRTEGVNDWYADWTGLIQAAEDGINANDSEIQALAAITNGGFGLEAGAVHLSVKQPSDNHVELEYPSGTDFVIDDHPDLYANVSTDLTDFSAIASGTNADLYGIAYNDSRMIAVGVNKGLYSLDAGVNWSSASVSPNGVMRSVDANGLTGASAVICAVGDADVISISTGATSGDTWATQTSPVLDSAHNWSDVKWFAGTVNKFVAIGYKETSPDVFSTKIASSADGATWAIEKTIAGRFESIAYNNNDGSVDEFLIVGWANLGSTHSAQKSSSLSGTWSNVTVDGAVGFELLQSVEYYNDGSSLFYAVGGLLGVVGYMVTGGADISMLTPITGAPNINRVVADATEGVIYALSDLTDGVASIYQISTSGWTPEGVGSFALHDYVNTGSARVVAGNGGTVFRTTSAAAGSFTMPYPSTVVAPSPYSWWVLTRNIRTTGSTGVTVGQGDLSKLKTGWFYVQVKSTTTDYIRCFAQSSDGTLVCGGDNGTLFKSTDFGSSWTDIGTALGIAGDVISMDFASDGILLVLTDANSYVVAADFASVITSSATVDRHFALANPLSGYIDDAIFQGFSGSAAVISGYYPNPTYGSSISVGASASNVTYEYGENGATAGLKPLFDNANSLLFPVNNSDGDMYYCALAHDRSYSTYTVATTTPSDAYIAEFRARNHRYSELYDEFLVVGDTGKAYVNSKDFSRGFQAITTGITFGIEDCAFIAGAWVMLTRRGCLYTTDSATVTNLTSSDESITTKPAGNSLIAIPTQFRLVANDLGLPGYVRVCQL